MEEKMLNFFNSIGFKDESGKFSEASISRVVLDEKEESFEVFIENDSPIDPNLTYHLLECARKGIYGKNKCTVHFIYNTMEDQDILDAFKVLLSHLILKRPSLVSLENKNITIDDDFIIIELDSRSEIADVLKKEIKNLVSGLIELGFYEMEITTALNKENEKKIQEEIEEDKNRKITIIEEPVLKTSGGNWSPKKKIDYSRDGIVTIESIDQEENNVHLEAYIFGSEFNQLKTKDGRDLFLITLKISDTTSSILAKSFAKDEQDFIEKSKELKEGTWFSFKGQVRFDTFADDLVFNFRSYEPLENVFSKKREDLEEEKRCELHAHTMMSQMDGVCDEVKLVKQAIEWGHKGIAITDHDCCQSFPHVFGEVTSYNKGLKKKSKAKIEELKTSLEEIKDSGNTEGIKEMEEMLKKAEEEAKNIPFFKAGYGAELEMCESFLSVCYNPNEEEIEGNTFVIFDTETTGFNPGLGDSMIEIGGIKIKNGEVIDRFDELINPGHPIDEAITRVTDISDDDVKSADNEENVTKRFKDWIGSLPLVAHNARFDKNMLDMAYYKYDLGTLDNPIIDTLMLSRVINRDLKKHSLKALGKFYGIDTGEADEEEEESVNESGVSGVVLDPEIGELFTKVLVDGEEALKIEKQEYYDTDIASEERVKKYRNIYHLQTIHKASKTEKVVLCVEVKEGVTLVDFDENVTLHPAGNELEIKVQDTFGEKVLPLTIYVGQHHGADVDSENTGYIFAKMLNQIKGIKKISDFNHLSLLEDLSFQNDPKKLEHIGDLVSYKNYIVKETEDNPILEDSLGYPFKKYNLMDYRFKFPCCKEDWLQMYENIPGKTFSEHLANLYDNGKHVTFIAQNKIGLKNLFKIVSYANTNFITKNARIPRKLIEENREGLLVGSACLNGEIFYLAETRCEEDLCESMKFYDYIEVQPPQNYSHLLRGHDINNLEHLYTCLKKIIRCAKKMNKLIVATGDVHNINPEDSLYREIIVNQNVPGKGRHPLARYLASSSKRCTNLENIQIVLSHAEAQGVKLNEIDIKVLKYIYVLTKVKKIAITAFNIASIYVPDKKNSFEDLFRGKDGENEKEKAVSSALRKLNVAGIIQEKEGVYHLTGYYNDSLTAKSGHIPNQFFRTTREMKEEFSFLEDKELIHEIVVENPNKIIASLEEIEVVDYPEKPYSPIIPHSQETCRDLVFEKAHSMYGNPLPSNIEERIAQEFYGDKITDLVSEQFSLDFPDKTEEEKNALFSSYLHDVIMRGYDGVIELKKEQIKRLSETEISDEEAIEKAKSELTGIIGGGFDVIYLIAQKLVKHSNDDGYLVGSRGSVGSSFVASMMGITECNGLPAHYYCPKCCHSEFMDENGVSYAENYPSGFDLPEKVCPHCKEIMIHQGNDMPFATFLGFAGEKVPDIDLNFSGDNQAAAHEYTKVLFGTDNVYRAGTIGTVADKTAFGYVQGFYEERLHDVLKTEAASYGIAVMGKDDLKKKGVIKSFIRIPEIERLSVGCTGVKRTTGQHPGGIVVVPGYKDIWDFTPFQYPADDPTSAWRTTHFDYHAIDADLLKLDILGHDDPTVLRMLQDLAVKHITHGEEFDVTKIDLGDLDTMKIFTGPEILGVDRYKLRGSVDKNGRKFCPTGTLGVPEFGTSFLLGMLEETKPTTFAELIKISGLSHGTDVWLGNARDLCIPNEKGIIEVPFKDVIGCRDDIMVNLIQWGMKPAKAFKIMEFVRKGKPSKDPATWAEHAKTMREANIPEWYIESCRKIKYMFPKAHATAYVTSAFRIAWFKVHYPILYYCAYLSIRRDQFDISSMIKGADAIRDKIDEIDAKGNQASNKELDTRETLLLCLEMCERGFYFKNIDVDLSDGKKFLITEDEKGLIIPFRALDGLGENVANAIVKARQGGPFISIEDLRERGKVNNTSLEKLKALGCLDNMSESNQLSLF